LAGKEGVCSTFQALEHKYRGVPKPICKEARKKTSS